MLRKAYLDKSSTSAGCLAAGAAVHLVVLEGRQLLEACRDRVW